MIKRLAKILLFIPILFLDGLNIVFGIIKWLFTGKEVDDYSILHDFLDW